jgi:hypothetical protein
MVASSRGKLPPPRSPRSVAAARAKERTPGREAGGPALSCALSNFLPRKLNVSATKLDIPQD